jgi:hypothetical protein
MTEYEKVAERVSVIKEKLAVAEQRSGRTSGAVKIMAVTKFHPEAAVWAAYQAGLRLFGENRVQEAEQKYSATLKSEMPGIQLDMIGNLQSNKINKALALFDGIQSVNSLELFQGIVAKLETKNAQSTQVAVGARIRKKPLRLFLELNTAEDSKSGFTEEGQLLATVEAYASILEEQKENIGISLTGLMTMAPFTTDEGAIRASFSTLRRIFEDIRTRFRIPGFTELSMGMSGDYEIAVEEGSTLVRIGTAIFGERQ